MRIPITTKRGHGHFGRYRYFVSLQFDIILLVLSIGVVLVYTTGYHMDFVVSFAYRGSLRPMELSILG